MGKKVFKLFSIVLIALMVLGMFTACGGDSKKSTKDLSKIDHTYRDVWTAGPLNWNPHSWEMSGDSAMLNYITTGFVYATMGDNEGEWKWGYDAATEITDITKDFADKAKFDIPADAEKEIVYQIKLNPEMKWENGDKINADDYIESMKRLLDPNMKNYRANTYCTGDSGIRNALGYFNNDKAGKSIYADFAGKDVPADAVPVFSLTEKVYFFGDKAETYYNKDNYKDKFIVDGVDVFEKYKGQTYIEVTDESKALMLSIAKAFGDGNPEAWKEFALYDTGEKHPETPWDKVGLIKKDDYTLIYITNKPTQMFYFMTSMTGNWLVHLKTYDKFTKTVEKLKASSYGTGKESTMSYGPYKVANYEKDKQIRLVRNEHWGGYHDGRHKGQYVADCVIIDIISNHATMLQRFGKGLVDEASLTSDDIDKYRKSDRLYYIDESYTARYIFATSLESLKARDAEKGSGKRVMIHYKDFRKAMSLSIDRAKYCKEATSGFKPAYFLFNTMFYYDIGNDPDSMYRKTKYAKAAVLDLYDMDYNDSNIDAQYDKVTGRDLGYAKELFKKAYDQAVADGNYSDGELVPIEVMVHPKELSAQHIKKQDLLQEFFDEGTKGTPFEGKIKLKFEAGDPKRYDNVAQGKNMAIWGAWGGAYFYPFSSIQVYTNPDHVGGPKKIHESNGWDATKEMLTIKVKKADGSEYEDTRSFCDWSKAINGDGDFADAPADEKLQILARLENGVLSAYQCIPVGTMTAVVLVSYKIDYAVDNYHVMYGFGGLRHLVFNYTDKEWEAYLAENGGKLNYE